MGTRTLLAVGVAAGMLAGCSSDDTTTEQTSSPTSQVSTSQSSSSGGDDPSTPGESTGVDSAVSALQTAADAVSGQPFDIETDTRGGQKVWEVKVAVNGDEYEVWVSADGTKVVDTRKHDTPDDDVKKAQSAKVGAVEALRKASEKQKGTLEEMDLDSEGGTIVWEVELRQADGSTVEVEVNAATGEVRVLAKS